LKNDQSTWESDPLVELSKQGNLMAYEHHGFWQAMDTLRDKTHLEELWATGKAPWKNW
jgi:glucose-1-phosphate cytidylyltransferase